MDFDRNYIGGYPMGKWEQPSNMCDKYVSMYNNMNMPYGIRGDYIVKNMQQSMEPLENLCGSTYKILIVHVHKTMHKIMMENMGIMPKAISKEKFKKELNTMLCEVMKNEEGIKKIVVLDRDQTDSEENENRAFCPYCNGLLKDTLSILFITELLKGGCISCY